MKDKIVLKKCLKKQIALILFAVILTLSAFIAQLSVDNIPLLQIEDEENKVAYAADYPSTYTVLTSSTSSQTLNSGTYYVNSNVSIIPTATGISGLNIASGATVTIYIASGRTLTCKGVNGSGRTGGGAGIYLPSGSTLYIRGGGTVIATGGNGGNAENGGSGGGGSSWYNTGAYMWNSAGAGGYGGYGAGGPGAGIGGSGGTGGARQTGGGSGFTANNNVCDRTDGYTSGNSGYSGNSGSAGVSMGTLYILDSISVTATAGTLATASSGGSSGSYGTASNGYYDGMTTSFAGGGGGGGGGGIGTSSSAIGGGGGGGGSGGSGGSGGTMGPGNFASSWGYAGSGSSVSIGGAGGAGDGCQNTNSNVITVYGGSGGGNGSSGSNGSSGLVYKTATATVNVSTAVIASTYNTTYGFTFDTNRPSEATNTVAGTMTATGASAYTYTTAANLPVNTYTLFGWSFTGWNTKADGSGVSFANQQSIYKLEGVTGEIALYAQWTPSLNYTITYDINKPDKATNSVTGTVADSEHYYDIYKTLTPNAYALVGWTFIGWNTSKDGSGTSYTDGQNIRNLTTITETLTLHAQWRENYYTINYYSNKPSNASHAVQSTMINTTHQYDEIDPLRTNSFTIASWNFVGWNTKADGTGTSYADEQEVTKLSATDAGTVSLYGQWSPYEYTVRFDLNKPVASTREATGETATLPCVYDSTFVLTANGYAIEGWTYLNWNSQADGTGTSYADGASVINLTPVEFEEVVLYAQWSENNYEIRFDVNRPAIASSMVTGLIDNEGYTYEEIKPLTVNAYSLLGWTYQGWNTLADGTGDTYFDEEVVSRINSVDDAITVFYAQWTQNSYSVTYKFNKPANAVAEVVGATANSFHIYDTASAITDNGFVLTGWTFAYWNTKADGTGDTYTDEQDISTVNPIDGGVTVFYAQWLAHNYTVQFIANKPSGSSEVLTGTMADMPCVYDQYAPLTTNAYAVTGWTMTGWNVLADGTSTAYENSENLKNLNATNETLVILYAQWTENEYHIVFDTNKPINASAEVEGQTDGFDCMFESNYILTSCGYSLTGWSFTGWNTLASGTGNAYSDNANVIKLNAQDNGTVTMYAQWTAHTYTVTYLNNKPALATASVTGSTVLSSHTYDTASALTANAYALTGWTFTGWNTAADGSGDNYANAALLSTLNPLNGSNNIFYAQWSENSYRVIYNNNKPATASAEVEGETLTSEVNYETVFTLTENGYSLIGWTFTGWNTFSNGTGTAYTDAQSVSKVNPAENGTTTLYAQWTENNYSIVYYKNKPSTAKATVTGSTATTNCLYESSYDLTANGYALTGWTYTGWNTAADGSGQGYTNSQTVQWLDATDEAVINLYAQWSVKVYTVTYVMNDGTNNASNPASYIYDDNDINLNDPVKTGYTFFAWSEGASIVTANMVDVTRTALWSANQYSIKYFANKPSYSKAEIVGATAISSHTYDTASALTNNGFSLTGWKFSGWNTAPDGSGDGYTDGQNISTVNPDNGGQTAFYAQWTEQTYYVNYVANTPAEALYALEGAMDSTLYSYDTAGALVSSNYTLRGWHQNGWNTVDDGSGTAYADGGEVIRLTAEDGNTVYLYAQWIINQYTVEYDSNIPDNASADIAGATADSLHTYDYTKELQENGYTLKGWKFNVWNTKADGSGLSFEDKVFILNLTEEYDVTVTLFAQWTANTYTVNYDANKPAEVMEDVLGEMSGTAMVYDIVSKLAVNAYTLTEYKVIGWNTLADGTGDEYGLEADVSTLTDIDGNTVTLYAHWLKYDYIVLFDANVPEIATNVLTGSMREYVCVNDTQYTLNPNMFAIVGWKFSGWNTEADGSGISYTDQTVFENISAETYITLFAQWEQIEYTVKFFGNKSVDASGAIDGNTDDQIFSYEEVKALTANGYALTGWTFAGWNTVSDGNGDSFADGEIISRYTEEDSGIIIIYAQWTKNSYSVKYKANKPLTATSEIIGTTGKSFHIYDEESALNANGYILTGWTFDQWNTAADGSGVSYDAEDIIITLNAVNGGETLLYAQWIANDYNIMFVANKPVASSAALSGTMAVMNCIYDIAVNLNVNAYAVTGWTMTGWNTFANGNGTAYADGQNVLNLQASDDSTIILYAQWRVNSYLVAYDANKPASASGNIEGSTDSTECVYENIYEIAASGYTLTGWTFDGWNSALDGSGTAYNAGDEIFQWKTVDNEVATVYAQWTANLYTVSYESNKPAEASSAVTGETLDSDHTYDVENNLTLNGYALTGWVFVDWNTAANGSGASYTQGQAVSTEISVNGEALILYAQWEIVEYTITYVLNDGTNNPSNPFVYTYEDEDILLAVPEKLGYTFTGWLEGEVIETSGLTDTTRTALWEANNYFVAYESNKPLLATAEIIGSTETSAHIYDVSGALTLNGFGLTGWTFTGWNTVADGTGTNYTDGQNISVMNSVDEATSVLYAQWSQNKVTVVYIGNKAEEAESELTGETLSSEHYYDTVKELTVNGYELLGWHFTGWNTDSDGTGANYTDGETVVRLNDTNGVTLYLYAQWEINKYIIAYNQNKPALASAQVNGVMPSEECLFDVLYVLSNNVYVLTGWTFTGWNTLSDGSGNAYGNGAEVTNLTSDYDVTVQLYAQWEANTYTVSYILNKPVSASGEAEGETLNSEHVYDVANKLSVNGFKLYGYDVIAWNTQEDGNGESFEPEAYVTDLCADNGGVITLYAEWAVIRYFVAYDDNKPQNASGTIEGEMIAFEQTYDFPSTLAVNVFALSGWTFNGWNTASDGSGDIYADGEEILNLTETYGVTITLYAQWTANVYTVTYEANKPVLASGEIDGETLISSHVYDTASKLSVNGYVLYGYAIITWNTASDGSGNSYTLEQNVTDMTAENNSEITLYAQWSVITYFVSYNTNIPQNASGVVSGEMTVVEQIFDTEDSLDLNAYSLTGWTFTGWNSVSGGSGDAYADGESIFNLTSVHGTTIVMYAQWSANTYSVSYEANKPASVSGEIEGETLLSSHVYDTESKLSVNGFNLYGYAVVGWNTVADGTGDAYELEQLVKTMSAENNATVTLYAQWAIIEYYISYNSNCPADAGSAVQGEMADVELIYNNTFTLNANVYALTGYSFIGWNTNSSGEGDYYADIAEVLNLTNVDGSVVILYAQWQANVYYVNYDANKPAISSSAVTGETENSVFVYNTAANLTENGYAMTGYTFTGWNTAADGTGSDYADLAEILNLTDVNNVTVIFYAQWSANVYTVSYDTNKPENAGGTVNAIADSEFFYDSEGELTSTRPQLTGWVFTGWNTVADGSCDGYTFKQTVLNLLGVTLYAQWRPNTYTVVFYANKPASANGTVTGTTENTVYSYDTSEILTANGYNLTGWTFAGWNTLANGTGTNYADSASIVNLTAIDQGTVVLYALWTINHYTIVFKDKDNAVLSQTEYAYGSPVTTPSAVSDYEDATYYYDFAGWSPAYSITAVQNVIYTPVYNANKKTISTVSDSTASGEISSNSGFDTDYTLAIEKISTSTVDFESVLETGETLNLYSATVYCGTQKVSLEDGSYTLTVAVEGYEDGTQLDVLLNTDGRVVRKTVIVQNGNVVFEINEIGDFAIVEETAEAVTPDTPSESILENAWFWVSISSLILILILVIAVFFRKRNVR